MITLIKRIFNWSVPILRNWVTKPNPFITLTLCTLLFLAQATYAAVGPLTLNLTTDDYGEETWWEIIDLNDDLVASGGDVFFYDNNTSYTETIDLPTGTDYIFTIYDDDGNGNGGDGILSPGGYSLEDAEGTIIASGGDFTYEEYMQFDILSTVLTLTGTPATTIKENQAYSFIPTVFGADGSTLTFSINPQPSWATFNGTTGALTGTPTATGTTTGITITVSNASAETATLTAFNITVVMNTPPTITGTPDTSIDAGASYSFTPTTSDIDNDDLTFKITNMPVWADFDETTGKLTGTPTYNDLGTTHQIQISVFDGSASVSLALFNLTVNTSPTIALFAESSTNPLNNVDVGTNSIPIFADLDNDGDLDAVIGEYDFNIVNYYENTGTALVEKTGATNPFNGINVGFGSSPALVDIDNDGDLDAFLGSDRGTLVYYKNTGTSSSSNFEAQSGSNNPFDGVTVVSKWSTPTFVDIDKDGDLDAFIGEYEGTLNYFENTGTVSSPIFVERVDTNNPLNNIDVGFVSKPRFVDIDHDGDFDAFIGEAESMVNYYENVGTARNPYFTLQVNPFMGIDIGGISAPTFIDWDKDDDWDAFIGAGDGAIRYYENLGPVTGGRFINQALVFKGISMGKYSAASLVDIDNDGDLDAFIGEEDGVINYYKNTGTPNNPLFVEQTNSANPFEGIDIGSNSYLAFADIDADDDFDAFIGEINGTIKYYQNTGTATDSLFEEQTGTANPLNEVNLGTGSYSEPFFIDIDQDGDLDVFIGGNTTHYYRNDGTNKVPNFVEQNGVNNPFNNKINAGFSFSFVDFDGDDDFDVFFGEPSGVINYFENTGTASIPNFVARMGGANPFADVDVGKYSFPFLADIDNDGSLDALIGEEDGTIQHYEYTSITNALPHGGNYNFAPQVYLKCFTCDKFYYTLNGSTPTTSSTQYTNPLAIPADTITTLKYISVSGGTTSEVITETYFIDTQAPIVTITAPKDKDEVASLPAINGTATDVSGGIGVDYTEIQMKNSSNLYLAADGGFISTPTWLQATDVDNWSYNTSNVTFPAGNYTITARAFDKLENISAEVSLTIGIAKGFTGLYLESDSATILNDGDLTLIGKLNRFPETTEDLSNLPITLTIIAPDGTPVEINTVTNTDTGQFRFDKDTTNFPTFSQEGAYSFQAKFAGTEKLVISESSQEMVLVGASAGYAILVQGKIQNKEGLAAHKKTSNRIYKTLKERGFEDDNLYYFNYSDTTDKIIVNGKSTDIIVRGKPTKTAIAQAFTDLQGRMNSNPASLYIIMINHGGIDGTFHIYDASNGPNDNVILPSDIDNWLDTLETGLSANAKKKARLAILGYCYSGGFISELTQKPTFTDPADPKTVVDGGRIIITSATAQEESYKGPEEPDGVRSGEFFMEEFFTRLNNGDNIKQAFEFATEKTEAFTRKGGDTNTANRFYDEATQHPLLDDDGDGKGSNSFTTVGDSHQANQVLLGIGVNYDTNFAGNPAEIMSVSNTIYLGALESTAALEAKVNNASSVNSAPVDIRKPSVILNSTGTETSEQLEITNLPRAFMNCSSATQSCVTSFDKFTDPGKYEAFYFVRDAGTNDISPIKRSVIYKNYANNPVPSVFELVEPFPESEHKTTLMFKWDSSTDADGPVTYNIIIAKDTSFSEVVYQQEELEIAMTYMDDSAGLEDQTTYYWKIEAVDPFGARTTSTSVFSFETNNTNAPPGIGSLHVSSALDFTSIGGAEIEFLDEFGNPLPDFNPDLYQDQGDYNMLLPHGRRRARIQVADYEPQVIDIDTTQGTTRLNVELIPVGGIPTQPGELQFTATTVSLDENTGTATILVERVNGSDTGVTVNYATTDGSATAGSDYTNTSGTLTWPDKDERAKAITLPITDDSDYEGDETFIITLSNPTGGEGEYLAKLGTPTQITVTIVDDEAADPVPGILQFSTSSYSGTEGNNTLNITVERTGGSDGQVSVQYRVNGTATLSQDYTGGTGTLTWNDGDSNVKLLNLNLIDDKEIEESETLNLTLFSPTGEATLGNPAQAILTITDNDEAGVAGVLQFSTSSNSVKEGDGTLNIIATRTGGNSGEVSVQYMTTGASTANSSDYTGGSGTLTWADGDSSDKSFTINISDDEDVEDAETIQFTLMNPLGEATLGSPAQTTVTISDNDVAIEEKSETKATPEPVVTLEPVVTPVTPEPVAEPVVTPVAPEPVVTMPAPVVNPESVTSTPIINPGTMQGTSAGILQFASTTYVAEEDEGDLYKIVVNRTGGSHGEVSVQYLTTVASTATFGLDFMGGNGMLTWADGDTEAKSVSLNLIKDNETESLETVNFMLSNPTGQASLGTQTQTTLVISDMVPEIEPIAEEEQDAKNTTPGILQFLAPFYTTNEGIGNLTTFTVTRREGSDGEVSVAYTTDGGSALLDYDYVGGTGELVWKNGDTTPKSIALMILDDKQAEDLETIPLILSEPTGGAILGVIQRASLIVVDNDGQYRPDSSQESNEYSANPEEEESEVTSNPGEKESEQTPSQAKSESTSPALPSLGNGMGVSIEGTIFNAELLKKSFDTKIRFQGGAKANAQNYQSSITLSPSRQVKIVGEIEVDAYHVGKKVDILIVKALFNNVSNAFEFLMFGDEGQIVDWDGDLATLIAAEKNVTLSETQPVDIYRGWLKPAVYQIYFGYRLTDGFIFFNGEQPIEIQVTDDELISHEEEDSQPIIGFSPDNSQIITRFIEDKEDKPQIWDVDSGLRLAPSMREALKPAAFSPETNLIIIGSENTAHLWDIEIQQEIAVLTGHEGNIEYITFGNYGKHVLTALTDGTIYLWETETAELLATLKGHEDGIKQAAFSEDGKHLVTASWDGTARLWQIPSEGKGERREISAPKLALFQHDGVVEHAAFSPDGKQIITTSWDKTAQLWNVDTGQKILTLTGHRNGVSHATFNPEGEYIVTTSWDNSVRLWEAKTGETIWVREHQSGVNHAVFSPDGQIIVTGSNDGTARLWKTATGEPLKTLKGHKGNVWHVGFSPNGKRVISASWDDTVRVWEVETGELLTVLKD
ncbi:Calx-beta domain-containing protein [Candidatus Parabeggiatoa sp. HSG14]|uniref:Calx-beta domain-containing protein n=1 Tax=Candidatus Parabeggiatoa sp. HSG14 TaxID=3055593 RepID=UPI0025A8623C|nr:Calx-beta domain-containing protein [Thiotrichales bacterium HSG14]